MTRPTPLPKAFEEKPTILALLRDIQSGAVDPKTIPAESRIAITGHLTTEGFSVPEIAEILKVHERTAWRDREKVRAAHAIVARPELAGEMAGRLVQEADSAVVQIRRAARDKEASLGDRINAAKEAWAVTRGLTEILQRLGFLPTAPTHVKGELLHHVQHQVMEPDAMVQELDRIRQIAEAHPGSAAEHLARIEAIRAEVRKVEISSQIKSLSTSLETKGDPDEQSPE